MRVMVSFFRDPYKREKVIVKAYRAFCFFIRFSSVSYPSIPSVPDMTTELSTSKSALSKTTKYLIEGTDKLPVGKFD